MKNLKRFSIIMMLVCFFTYTASALTSGEWDYTDNGDGTSTLTHYRGSDTEVVIPAIIDGLPVKTMCSGVQYKSLFVNNSLEINWTIRKVFISDGITGIGRDAFFMCRGLTHAYLPEGITSIGIYAFGECRALEWVHIPESVTSLDHLAFFRTWVLKSIVIPKNVTVVGNYCFDQAFGNWEMSNPTPEIIFEGNAPSFGNNSFRYYTPNIYYQSGATGFTGASSGYWDTTGGESLAVTELPVGAFTLNVTNGSGSGVYTANELVTIKAETIAGKKFSYWARGTYTNVEDIYAEETVCRMTSVTAATVEAVYVFNPATAEHLVPGKVTQLEASDIGLTQFTRRPTISAKYYDAYRGRWTTTRLRVLTNISSRYIENYADACWVKNVCLYSKIAFRDWYKSGKSAKDFTDQSKGYELTLSVKHRENGVIEEVTLDKPFSIVPPEITSLGSTSPVSLNDTIVVNGTDFGNRAPKVWLEYTDTRGQTKMLRCKVLKPYVYDDVKNIPEKSCMDKDTGISQILVQLPSKWPIGWTHGTNNLVLDNGIGLATIEIETL